MKLFCIDIGGTETKYAQLDGLELNDKGRYPTPYGDAECFMTFLQQLWQRHGTGCAGIAVSMPGLIDSSRGYVHHAGGMLRKIQDIPLAQQLASRTGVPASVENDAKCAAMAELCMGSLQGCRTAAVIILGTGVGGALIQDGKLYRGAHLFAGEFSYVHTNQDAFDRKDNVLAVRCGGKTLRAAAAERLGRSAETVDGYTIFDLAEAGDQRMLDLLRDYARQIARFAYNLQCIYDPEKIAVGGGISARQLLIRMIQQEVAAIYENDPFGLPRAVVTAGQFHNDANLIGAGCVFRDRE